MWSWRRQGQMDREDRAAAWPIACCFDIASMKLDYAFDNRESEASGTFTCRWSCRQPLEAAEQPRQVILRQASPFVPYLDFGAVRLDRQRKFDMAARRAILDRIADQIVDGLTHPVRITVPHLMRRRDEIE